MISEQRCSPRSLKNLSRVALSRPRRAAHNKLPVSGCCYHQPLPGICRWGPLLERVETLAFSGVAAFCVLTSNDPERHVS